MPRHNLGFLALTAVLIFTTRPIAGEAQAQTAPCDPRKEICIGKSCDPMQRGVTLLDFDKKNILACLAGSDGTTYYWKQNSIGNMKCTDGQTLQGIEAGQPVCATATGGGGSMFRIALMSSIGVGTGVDTCSTMLSLAEFQAIKQLWSYSYGKGNSICCVAPNPVTGRCSCPAGAVPYVLSNMMVGYSDSAVADSTGSFPSIFGCFALSSGGKFDNLQ
ncbi:MAG: hypothetical protein FWF24_03110 [Alphaproteobacteria bacterium]|nr:hypothetical protein [Alphaproteobacteria bacterium]